MKKIWKFIKKNKLKILMLILAIIIAVLLGIGIATIVHDRKYQYQVEEISDYQYYLFYQEGKVGVLDTKGNILISPIYYSIQIPNPSKPVFVCLSDYNLENGSYTSKVYNEKVEEIITDYDKVEALSINGTVSSIPYEKSVLKYEQEGKYGLITLEGKVITKPIYEEIQSLKYKEGQFLVKQEGKYGVINQKGEELIPTKYDDIAGDSFYTEENKYTLSGYIVCIKTQDGYRYGYLNYKGRTLLDTQYSELERMNQIDHKKDVYIIARKNGKYGLVKNKEVILEFDNQNIEYDNETQLLKVEKNNKFGVYDITGKQILEKRYSEVEFKGIYIHAKLDEEDLYFDKQGNQIENMNYSLVHDTKQDDYYITVNQDGLYGIMNKNKEVLVDNQYHYLEYAYENYFIAYNDENKLGVIDEKNNKIIDFQYDVLSKLENSNILQGKILTQDIVDLYSKQMKKIISFSHAIVLEKENNIEVYNGSISKYFDKEGNELASKEVQKNNQLYAKEENGKYGFCDAEDNIKIECIYEGVTEFNRYGFAGIKQDGKWGVINTSGEIIQEPVYSLNDTEIIPDFIGKYYKVEYEYGQVYYTNTVKE